MDPADDDTEPTRPRALLVVLAFVAVIAVSVLGVLTIGGAISGRLEDEDPANVTVTQGHDGTTTTTEEPVVLAPPVSIDVSTTA